MRIFIQEFAAGGGLNKEKFDPKLIIEGIGILRSLVTEFKRNGFIVETTLDYRLTYLKNYLIADSIYLIQEDDDSIEKSKEIVKNCDFFLVIAPGTNGILSKFVSEYSQTKCKSLNSNPNAIDFVTNKNNVYELCVKEGFLIPHSALLENHEWQSISNLNKRYFVDCGKMLEELSFTFPIIIKPNDGVGCEELHYFQNYSELDNYLNSEPRDNLLLQNFLSGDHLSVTAFISENEIEILSINRQLLDINTNFSQYLGGATNIQHPFRERIYRVSKALLSKIPGLYGFIGVDFIWLEKHKEFYVIEINPRPTTPICGLKTKNERAVFRITTNDSLTIKINPETERELMTCYFSKHNLNFHKFGEEKIYSILINDECIITPPIKITESKYTAFIKGCADNYLNAKENYQINLSTLQDKLK